MTKRRKTSPYPKPPTDFVRSLMRDGWRRCDAEGVDAVRRALGAAHDSAHVAEAARLAAAALERGPVLAGANYYLARLEGVSVSARQLFFALAPSQPLGLMHFLATAKLKASLDAFTQSRAKARESGHVEESHEAAG